MPPHCQLSLPKKILFDALLSPAVQRFIHEHQHHDVRQLVLHHREVNGVPIAVIADQIAGRRKAGDKIPTLANAPGIVYPPGVNLEQSSSEKTALYKNKLFANIEHHTCIDLTGGFGIDSYFFSRLFHDVHYVEPNGGLVNIVRHNHAQLHATNIIHHVGTAEAFLQSSTQRADVVYIDPSRRADGNQKVFSLRQCLPDVTQLLGTIFDRTHVLLVKTSPLLDLHQGARELPSTRRNVVVSVDNECKEVLFWCEKDFEGEPHIEAVNITTGGEEALFTFTFGEERNAATTFGDPARYLYEPNASILKAGAFKLVGQRYALHKMHVNTHLYSGDVLIENFPGRAFEIVAHVKPDAKAVKAYFPEGQANVTTRNYPLSVDALKKKTGLSDGGSFYLVAFGGVREKFVVVARRLY